MTLCSVEGCCTVVRARGWCAKHYQRWSLRGSLADPLPARGRRVAALDAQRVCLQCGKTFSPSTHDNVYCDGFCLKKAMASRGQLRYAVKVASGAPRVCAHPLCEQSLPITAHGNQTLCSATCVAATVRENGRRSRELSGRGSRGIRSVPTGVRSCATCRKPFLSLNGKHAVCDECSVARQLQHRGRPKRRNDTGRICTSCQAVLTPETHAARRRCDDCVGTRRGVQDATTLRKYKISAERYAEMAAAGCGICGCVVGSAGRRLAVDHDHTCCPDGERTCGKCVRGLLCDRCNRGVGLLGDSVERLRAAIFYLEVPRTN